MKTKAEIVQDLLDKKLISAEEAVTLLSGERITYYIPPSQPPYYFAPLPLPHYPTWQINSFPTYSFSAASALN